MLLPQGELVVKDSWDPGETRVLKLACGGVKGRLKVEGVREVLLFIVINVRPHGY